MAMTFAVFVVYGTAAAGLRRHVIDRPDIVQRVRQVFAVSFVGLGVKLAATARSWSRFSRRAPGGRHRTARSLD